MFTGFTMAGAGMVKHHLTFTRAGLAAQDRRSTASPPCSRRIVVLIFAITKFTEGAWVVVVLFPLLVFVLIRLHHQYSDEKTELEANAARACEAPVLRRHVVLVFVERLDLATARALQYAALARPDEPRAVHFVLDTTGRQRARGAVGAASVSRALPLDLVECPDRRLARAAMELVAEAASDGQTEVSVLLPRRVFEGLWRRVLHDRTADRIAGYVSQLPNANATIVPFPLGKRRKELVPWRRVAPRHRRLRSEPAARGGRRRGRVGSDGGLPPQTLPDGDGVLGDGAGGWRRPRWRRPGRRRHLRGRSRQRGRPGNRPRGPSRSLRPVAPAGAGGRPRPLGARAAGVGLTSLECTISDGTGQLVLVFQGRRRVPGIEPGARLLVEGMVGERGKRAGDDQSAIYQILAGAELRAGDEGRPGAARAGLRHSFVYSDRADGYPPSRPEQRS